jgi:DNA-binding winged helix-turn-helix (wHTH) protein
MTTPAAPAVHVEWTGRTWDGPHPAVGAQPDLRDFHLDGWLVQPSLCRLTRGGVAVHVRPQLMDMLVCLAARAGKTMAREEIVATVWQDCFVAESGLSRCIAELRSALGDDARQPRIIETIRKRGYRLIAPVFRAAESSRAPGRSNDDAVRGSRPAQDGASPAALHLTAACPAPRRPRLDRAMSRLRTATMGLRALLWRRRAARSVVPGDTGEARTDGARAL